jgi:hypothetical protein
VNARRTTLKPPALLWSEDGRVCCVAHAPFPGSDTWRTGRWRRMRDHEITAFAAEIGRAVECETCRATRLRGAEAPR